MNKKISPFASTEFYGDQLIPHASVANRLLEVAMPGPASIIEVPAVTRAVDPHYPMVFLDVSTGYEREKINNAEALAVRELVAALLARGGAQQAIGIVAPYRAQVANLRRYLFSDDAPRVR